LLDFADIPWCAKDRSDRERINLIRRDWLLPLGVRLIATMADRRSQMSGFITLALKRRVDDASVRAPKTRLFISSNRCVRRTFIIRLQAFDWRHTSAQYVSTRG